VVEAAITNPEYRVTPPAGNEKLAHDGALVPLEGGSGSSIFGTAPFAGNAFASKIITTSDAPEL
jgi:hypothetical protein